MTNDLQKPMDLRIRTKQLALRVIRLVGALEKSVTGDVIGRQILRCACSVGAQYREACRARSNAEFVSKMESSLQELDETGYWLELLNESGLVPLKKLQALIQESDEMLAIFIKSILTAKKRPKT